MINNCVQFAFKPSGTEISCLIPDTWLGDISLRSYLDLIAFTVRVFGDFPCIIRVEVAIIVATPYTGATSEILRKIYGSIVDMAKVGDSCCHQE